jgi:hypothetical protein
VGGLVESDDWRLRQSCQAEKDGSEKENTFHIAFF